jgi:hypothetical protein
MAAPGRVVNFFGSAPVSKAAARIDIGSSRMSIVDLSREKFEQELRRFSRWCE